MALQTETRKTKPRAQRREQSVTLAEWVKIGIHSLRKTAINDAIRMGATMHEVREFLGHSDIRTTALYFIRKEEDAEVAARRIQIRVIQNA